jgi:hypothetical protein
VDLNEFTERFFSIERRLALFSDRSAGIPWWDAVRYHLFQHLFSALAETPMARPLRRPLYARTFGWMRRVVLRALLYVRIYLFKYDVMVFRAPRQMRDGRRLDPAIDDLLALCPGRALTINTFPDYYHLAPRRSEQKALSWEATIDRLVEALKSEFGSLWDEQALRRLIATRATDFEAALAVYRSLFARVQPRLIIMTQNGMEKALFLAAHEAGICAIEGQHGLIGYSHPAYSYPHDVDYGERSTFPAVFLAFSEYSVRSCFYPAGRCIPIGNDNFFIKPSSLPAEAGAIMFVSGHIFHEVLRDWVTRLAKALPDRQILYKLHPNQHHAYGAIRREFESFKNIEVIDATVSARETLPHVAYVVLIQSTVALEALQTGCRVCILPLMQYRAHKDLFQLQAVTITATLDDLVSAVTLPPDVGAPPSFFDPFDAVTAGELLRELLQPPPYRPHPGVEPAKF